MNKEVIKAMKKQGTLIARFKHWWSRNGYKVLRVILFPIWIISLVCEKLEKRIDDRQIWSEKRADEILNYYVPRYADWDEEDKSFYFIDNGRGWNFRNNVRKNIKLKDRKFWRKYCGFWGGEIRDYFLEKFELEGFTKELGDCSDGWSQITFKLIEKS